MKRNPWRMGSTRPSTPQHQEAVAQRHHHDPHQAAPAISSHSASLSTRTPSSAARLSFEPASAPATTKSVLLETEPVTFAPSVSARALASARVMRSSVPVKTTVFPASSDAPAPTAGGASICELAGQILDRRQIVRLLEELVQGFDQGRAHPVHIVELGPDFKVTQAQLPASPRTSGRSCHSDGRAAWH